MFRRPSRRIISVFVSFLSSHEQITYIIPFSTNTFIISGILFAVAFERAQIASL